MANSTKRTPSYLTTNRVGTYVFQVRIPAHIRQKNPGIKSTLWQSLGTKDRSDALRRSKRMWLMFDGVFDQFEDPEDFTKAMKLKKGFDKAQRSGNQLGWEFIERLDDRELEHLEIVLQDRRELKSIFHQLKDENQRQKKTIDHLNAGESTRTYTVEQNPAIQVVVDKFMRDKLDNGVAESSEHWYQNKIQLFVDIIQIFNDGVMPCLSDITGKMLKSYASTMRRYPKSVKTMPKTRNLSQEALVALTKDNTREELEEQGIPVIAFATIEHHFTAVRELIRFAHENADKEDGDFEIKLKLTVNIKAPKKPKGQGRGSKPRIKFSQSDLAAMFNTGRYTTGKFKRNSEYWVPLIAALGGQSQAEVCQLYVSDVKQDRAGQWYIDINDQSCTNDKKDRDFKALKVDVDGRPRDVPIHHQLINLGFLDFVEWCRKKGQVRLFPEEVRSKQANAFDPYSKRFNRWRNDQLNITVDSKGQKKDFHSYRHTVSSVLMGMGCEEGIVNDIVGHGSAMRSETRKTYSDGAWLEVKAEWVNRIEYEVDWGKVVKWVDVALLAEN